MKQKLAQIGILAVTAFTASASTAIAGYFYVLFYVVQPFQKAAVDKEYASWVVTNTATGATSFQWNDVVPEINVLDLNEKPLTK